MRLGPSPVQQLCGPRGSLPAPECSVPLWISTRSSVHGGVMEAKAPNYFQPLLKIFCAVLENSEVQSLCMLMGRGFMSWIKWERARWCWRLSVGRGGRFGVPWAAPCNQHQHSTQIAPTPRNGCKSGTSGCCFSFPSQEDPGSGRRLKKQQVCQANVTCLEQHISQV